MNLKKQYKNLKAGAKKLFIGLLILSMLSTATGIGSVLSYATVDEIEGLKDPSSGSNGMEIADPDEDEESNPEETKSEETKPEETKPEETNPEGEKPEEENPEGENPEETKTEETKPEEEKPEEEKPEEENPEEEKPEEEKTEEEKPEEEKPEEEKPEEQKPEEEKPEEEKPKETNPEETNPEETEPENKKGTGAQTDTNTDENRGGATEDNNGDNHEHDYTYSVSRNGDGTHTLYCECGSSTTENCEYGSDNLCTVCGAPNPEASDDDHVHDYTYSVQDNQDGTHTLYCECGDSKTEYCEYNANNVCEICGHEKTGTEEDVKECIEHEYEYTSNDALTHTGICKVCGDEIKEDHDFTDYEKTGNGTLKRSCTKCGYEEEIVDDGTENVHTHKYVYTDNGDGTHTGVCELCNEDDEDREITEAHKMGEWKADGKGNHTRTCALCDYTETEPCTLGDDGLCTVCGGTKVKKKLGATKGINQLRSSLLLPAEVVDHLAIVTPTTVYYNTQEHRYDLVSVEPVEGGYNDNNGVNWTLNTSYNYPCEPVSGEDIINPGTKHFRVLIYGKNQRGTTESNYLSYEVESTIEKMKLDEGFVPVTNNYIDFYNPNTGENNVTQIELSNSAFNSDSIPLRLNHVFAKGDYNNGRGNYGFSTLTRDSDYSISISSPSDGIPVADGSTLNTLTFAAKSDSSFYTGSRVIGFTLAAPTDATVLYNGEGLKTSYIDEVTISLGTGSAYKVSKTNSGYADSVVFTSEDITDGKAVLYAKNGTSGKPFKLILDGVNIVKKNLSDDALTVTPIDYLANTLCTLKYADIPLVENTDFTVEFPSDPPIADGATENTVKFTGKGDYEGSRECTFTVPAQAVTYSNGEASPTEVYTNTPANIYYNKVKLKAPTGFTISKSKDNFTETIEHTGIGENQSVPVYLKHTATGRVLKQVLSGITVKKKDLSDDELAISDFDFFSDNLATLTFTPVGGTAVTLTQGTDFTVDYPSGVLLADGSTEYSITFTGKGDYSGSTTKKFKIDPKTLKYDNSDLVASYTGMVRITAPAGYKIGAATASLGDSYAYREVGSKSIEVFLQTTLANGRIINLKQVTGNLVINPVNMADVTVTYNNYLSENQFTLTYTYSDGTAYTLEKGTDYNAYVTVPSDGVPIANGNANSNAMTFEGIGDKFTGLTVKPFAIDPKTVTFDGNSLDQSKQYVYSVVIEATGYKVGLSKDGTFADKVEYTVEGNGQTVEVYLRKDVGNKTLVIKQIFTGVNITPPPYDFDSFFALTGGAPVAAEGLVYNGRQQYLLEHFKVPVLPTAGDDESLSLVSATKESDFVKRDAAAYPDVTYLITYKYTKYKDNNKKSDEKLTEKTIAVSRNYGTVSIAPKDITEIVKKSDKLVKTPAGNYDFAKSNVDFTTDAFTFVMDGTTLVAGTDYTMDIELPSAGEAAPAGEHYHVNYAGKGNFTGNVNNFIEATEVEDITYNGSNTKADSYYEKVTIGAPEDYTISKTNGTFADSFVFDTPGMDQWIQVFLKNKTTGRVVSQKLTGINIKSLQVLYDGKPVMANYYHDSVRISADGFEVSTSKDGPYSNNYICNEVGKVPDFKLFFRATNVDYSKEVTISGLVIYKDIDLPVLYNGGKYKDWFNTDVKITCEGYEISDTEKGDFKEVYTVTKDGVNELTLYFRNINDHIDIQTINIIIRIDRDASKITIAVEDYISGEFQKEETVALNVNTDKDVTINTDDDVDYTLYYIGEKFYAAPGDLIRDVPETTSSWQAYDPDRLPKLQENKNNFIYAVAYDKAGNKVYVSTGDVIYDTIKPALASIKAKPSADEKTCDLDITGTDSLSGVKDFLLIYAEYTGKDIEKPTVEDMLAKGTSIEVTTQNEETEQATYTIKDLTPGANYMIYLVARDNAGNVCDVKGTVMKNAKTSQIVVRDYLKGEDYSSDDFIDKKDTAFSTNILEKVRIVATDPISGIATKKLYYISENYYATPSDVDAAIKETESMWRVYDAEYLPELSENRNNYIYARVTFGDGTVKDLSTKNIICDTVAPKLTTEIATLEEDNKSANLELAGSDTFSGITDFLIISKEVKSDDTDAPDADAMKNSGTKVKAEVDDNNKATAKYELKNLDPAKNYIVYAAAMDAAGNVSNIMSSILKSNMRIVVDDYVSTTFQTEDSYVMSSDSAKQITLLADDAKDVNYFISTEHFGTTGEMLAYVQEKSISWRLYSDKNKPKTIKDRKNYVYARFEKQDGTKVYLSTGDIIYDTIAPEVSDVEVKAAKDKKSAAVTLQGSDALSGVDHFMILNKEITSDKTSTPDAAEILKSGTKVTATKADDGSASGKYTIKDLDASQNYIVYVVSVDAAGNVSDIQDSTVRANARIEIGDYVSSKLQTKDNVALYTNTQKKATILGDDAKEISYYVSDKFYSTSSEVNAAIKDNDTEWRKYSSSSKPQTVENSDNYIYAKVVRKNDSDVYLSTGNVIYDTIAPTIGEAAVNPADDYKSATVSLTGSDSLSKVKNFYLISKKVTDKGVTAPTKSEMLSSGTAIKVKTGDGDTVTGKCTLKKLDPDGDYVVYVMAVDNAGNISEIKTRRVKVDARIIVEEYESSEFKVADAIAMYSNKANKARIVANNASEIYFYVSETYFATPEDVESDIKEKDSKWKLYSETYRPETVKDKKNYIYAKLINNDGSTTYLSTGDVIYDTKAPTVVTATVAPSTENKGSSVAAVGGKDELSGVKRFKLMYREKTADVVKAPDKDTIAENGSDIDVSKEEDGNAMGTYNISGLDATKLYYFYFAAVDNAGNISDVMVQEVDGKDATGAAADQKADAGAGGAGAGAGGLTPAPNGITGSGDKQKPASGAGSGSGNKQDTTTSPLGDQDREINRDPYIADATGGAKIGLAATGGWDKISSEVKSSDQGAVIEVEMAGTSYVSKKLFDSMNSKDVSVKLRMPNNVEWEIKGGSISQSNIADKDMGVKLGTRNIPDQHLNEVIGSNPHIEFSMTSKEDFGFDANITIPSDKSHAGMYATLYKYDAEGKDLVVAGTAVVDENGNVQFPISEAADYTVVISPEKILMASDSIVSEGVLESEEEASRGAMIRFTDIFGQRGGAPIWLFIIAIISAGLCIAILYMPSMQNKDDN